ncbi:O-methyltransferase [Streptantibioticus parmotrematis]|nr:O-methyltransferase [Streptantibioticus parmotrematis]
MSFGVWRLICGSLSGALAGADLAAELFDVYSALLLYSGSCTSQVYADAIRPRMMSCHSAFSGTWSRDYELVRTLLGPPLSRNRGTRLAVAVQFNRLVHMSVAKRLVPTGNSLLRDSGKAGVPPTDDERALFDLFFSTRRVSTCSVDFRTQMIERTDLILSDLAAQPVTTRHGRADLDRFQMGLRGKFERLVSITRQLTHEEGLCGMTEQEQAVFTADAMKAVPVSPELIDYVQQQAGPLSPTQRWLIDRTRALGQAFEMQIPPEQGQFLTLLARSIGASRIVEVGTFTGYSTLALAAGLGPEGQVLTCDLSDEWTAVAQEAWREAGVADRIELKLGRAADTLRALPTEPTIDLAFIDADKVGYVEYWELLVPRIRPGGLLLVDNVLYYGDAVSPDAVGNARAIREFNAHVLADDRVESVLLTIADGLTVARKKF